MTNTSYSNMNDCLEAMHAVSNGIWQGDLPLNFALPRLTVQIVIVLLVTRILALVLKPLRQPRVLTEIIGGVLLGPSALGRNQWYLETFFPRHSLIILDTVAIMGLLFFVFMVGMELDLQSIRRTGKTTIVLAFSGIIVPFVAGVGVSMLLRETLLKGVKLAPLTIFVGVPLSITAFGVLIRIMVELKILATDIGQMALPAAAINDLLVWVLLAIGLTLSGPSESPLTPLWVLLCSLAFVVSMMTVVKAFMAWIARRATIEEPINEIYVCITLLGVLVAGFITDAIGVHPIFGALLFGVIIPKEGNFARTLTEKIEDFVTTLMLPLFFASSGLKTNLSSIKSGRSVGFLVLLLATAAIGKITATIICAVAYQMPVRKALILGVLMNTKGLAEIIIVNIGRDMKVLNDEIFAILVIMCLLTTFVSTPIVSVLYKSLMSSSVASRHHHKLKDNSSKRKLRILACVHGVRNTAGMINLVEASRGTSRRSLKLYILHLVELSERPSTMMMLHRAEGGLSHDNRSETDRVFFAFEAYGKLRKVILRPMTVISGFGNMHQDICATAADKRVAILILPFHKYQRIDGVLEVGNPGFRTVNQKVLQHGPCSVGIFIDRGLGDVSKVSPSCISHNVTLLFFGGPDDREALLFACRMAEHSGTKLKVLRFLPDSEIASISIDLAPSQPNGSQISTRTFMPGATSESYRFSTSARADLEKELQLDEESLAVVKQQQHDREAGGALSPGGGSFAQPIVYEEQFIRDPIKAVTTITETSDCNLFVVGRGGDGGCTTFLATAAAAARYADKQFENTELGPIGDVLAGPEVRASVLVIRQHGSLLSEKGSFMKTVESRTATRNSDKGIFPVTCNSSPV